MFSENRIMLVLFIIVAAIHVLLILFFAINIASAPLSTQENTRSMQVFNLDEAPPLPPPLKPASPGEILPLTAVEAIAENMIETETVPDQIIVSPGTLNIGSPDTLVTGIDEWIDYLPMHMVSQLPLFSESEIMAALIYPSIAQRSGIEGRVILELFVDRNGLVQQIRILQETPPDRGFGEAAVKAFTGKRGTPAYSNGEPISARFRYPVSFKIK